MKFSIEVNRGSILDLINLAEENNLKINSIAQGPINNEMMNIKIDLADSSKVQNIDSFVKKILDCHSMNSCERI